MVTWRRAGAQKDSFARVNFITSHHLIITPHLCTTTTPTRSNIPMVRNDLSSTTQDYDTIHQKVVCAIHNYLFCYKVCLLCCILWLFFCVVTHSRSFPFPFPFMLQFRRNTAWHTTQQSTVSVFWEWPKEVFHPLSCKCHIVAFSLAMLEHAILPICRHCIVSPVLAGNIITHHCCQQSIHLPTQFPSIQEDAIQQWRLRNIILYGDSTILVVCFWWWRWQCFHFWEPHLDKPRQAKASQCNSVIPFDRWKWEKSDESSSCVLSNLE